ncbi:hypothetical protein KJ705_06050 [Patescibacteria group bacterium]|nr:hypothetical protein [Patescibacteria group bacterium]
MTFGQVAGPEQVIIPADVQQTLQLALDDPSITPNWLLAVCNQPLIMQYCELYTEIVMQFDAGTLYLRTGKTAAQAGVKPALKGAFMELASLADTRSYERERYPILAEFDRTPRSVFWQCFKEALQQRQYPTAMLGLK